MTQLPLFTAEDEYELLELLAALARSETPSMAEEEPGDPAASESDDKTERDGSGYWLKDWQDIVSEEVGVKRWGPI